MADDHHRIVARTVANVTPNASCHDYGVLGVLSIDGAPATDLRPAQRRLLSLLLLDVGRPIARDTLVDRMWPHHLPRTAENTLQVHVSALRRRLGKNAVIHEHGSYALVTDRPTDAQVFGDLVDRARRAVGSADGQCALDLTDRARALWRGRPFPDLVDDAIARPTLVYVDELAWVATRTRHEALAMLGRLSDALPELERLVVEHPHREDLWVHLVTARHHAGRRVEALAAYRRARSVLREVGMDPGPRLHETYQQLVREDRATVAPAGVAAAS